MWESHGGSDVIGGGVLAFDITSIDYDPNAMMSFFLLF